MKELFRYEPFMNSYIFSHHGTIHAVDELDQAAGEDVVIVRPTERIENGLTVPVQVQIQFTNRCNLACPHCYVSSGKPLNNEMSDVQIFDLLNKIRDWGVLQVEWSGGEPFTRRGLLQFAKTANEIGFEQKLLTNGIATGKVPGLAEELWQYFYSVQISMDGFSENFDKWVGKGTWNLLTSAIDKLSKLKPKWAELSVTTTLNPANLCDLVPIAGFLDGKVTAWKLARQVLNGRSSITDLESDQTLFRSWDIINKIRKSCNNLVIIHPFDKDDLNCSLWPIEWHTEPGARWFMYVSANGDCYPFPYYDNKIEFRAGNWLRLELSEVWSSPEFNQFRSVTRATTGCSGCQKVCQLWSRAFNYFRYYNLHEVPIAHPGCPLRPS